VRSFPLLISFLCLLYFRIWITSGFECVQPCRCARRACVRALAILRVGMATDVTWPVVSLRAMLCLLTAFIIVRVAGGWTPWITFFPAVRGYRYVRVICVCMCSCPLAVEFYYKFVVEVCFFLKSAFYIRRSGVVGSCDVHWYVSGTLQAGSRDQVTLLENYMKSDFCHSVCISRLLNAVCLLCSSFLRRWCWDLLFSSFLHCMTDAEWLHSRRIFTDGRWVAAFLDDFSVSDADGCIIRR